MPFTSRGQVLNEVFSGCSRREPVAHAAQCPKGAYRMLELIQTNSCEVGGHKTCPVCGRVFELPKDLARHLRTHTGEKPFACPRCPIRMSLSNNLKKHVISRHPDFALTTCPSPGCPVTFVHLTDADAHYRRFHGGTHFFARPDAGQPPQDG